MPRVAAVVDERILDVSTEEAAYWVGFLLADGCVYHPKEGRQKRMQIQLKDGEHLHKLKSWLGFGESVLRRSDGTGRFTFAASSNSLCGWLESYGVVPRKTGIERADPRLENNRHFWRGVVDGDGHIGVHTDKCRYREKRYEYRFPLLTLVGSSPLCESFSRFLGWGKTPRKIRGKKCFDIRAQGKKAVRAVKTMYSGSSIHLDRKGKKADEVVAQWPQ